MSNYTKVNRVLVGDGANSATPVASLATIKKGDLVLLDSKGNILTATTAAAVPLAESVYVLMGTGDGKYIKSSAIQGTTVEKYIATSYEAPVQKVLSLGYNGTSGDFVTSPGTEYRLRVHIKDLSRPIWQRPTMYDANYTVPTGGTSIDAALKLAALITQKDKGHSFLEGKLAVDVLSDGTAGTPVTTCSVNNGSREVVKAAHGLAAGVYVKIGGSTYSVAKVYGVNSFLLNMPYQGVSNASITVTPTTAIAKVGIQITGVPQVGFKGIDEYEIINFSAILSDADDSSNQYVAGETVTSNLNPGQGYWQQVFDAEMGSRGYLGQADRVNYDAKLVESNVVEGTGYGSIVITHNQVHMADFNYRMHSPLQTEIYIADGGAQGDPGTATNFAAILNAFITKGGHAAADLS